MTDIRDVLYPGHYPSRAEVTRTALLNKEPAVSVTARNGMYDGSGCHPLLASAGDDPADVRVVGDRSRLRSLMSWADQIGMGSDGLRALDHGEVRLDPATASRVADQLRRAGQVLRAIDVPSVAWASEPNGQLQGGVLGGDLGTPGGTVVLTGAVSVVASRAPQPHLVVTDHAHGERWIVKSWAVTGARSVTDTGSPLTPAAAKALAHLVGEHGGRVLDVPATSVVAGLITTLAEVARECASRGVALVVSTNPT